MLLLKETYKYKSHKHCLLWAAPYGNLTPSLSSIDAMPYPLSYTGNGTINPGSFSAIALSTQLHPGSLSLSFNLCANISFYAESFTTHKGLDEEKAYISIFAI